MPKPKVVQIAISTARIHGEQYGSGSILILTDTGEVWEQFFRDGCGDPTWWKVKLPWEVQEQGFDRQEAPDGK